ncbi:MAG: 50S ribosomal protein L28 [Rickettsiales bacterium]|nr:50S ribosomal protein L28 [Rickettsiales bacterium]
MSRKCVLTGTKIQTGNNVSNSNHKVRRIFAPNLQKVSLRSDLLNKTFQVKITTRTIRTISKYGSLDAYLLNTKANNMTDFGAKLKKQLKQIPAVQQSLQQEAEVRRAKRVVYMSARSKLKKTAQA